MDDQTGRERAKGHPEDDLQGTRAQRFVQPVRAAVHSSCRRVSSSFWDVLTQIHHMNVFSLVCSFCCYFTLCWIEKLTETRRLFLIKQHQDLFSLRRYSSLLRLLSSSLLHFGKLVFSLMVLTLVQTAGDAPGLQLCGGQGPTSPPPHHAALHWPCGGSSLPWAHLTVLDCPQH